MPLEVKDRSSCKFSGHETLIECAGSIDLLHKLSRDDLTCLVMTCISLENLRLERPVLHDL